MEESSYSEMAEMQATHWWFRSRRTIIASVGKSLQLPPAAQILEAGCGPGGNLAMLSQFGSVHAFEPHEASRIFSQSHGVAEVRDGTLPDGIPFDGPFDLICAFDVLEHVQADGASARALGALLAPGGRLLVTVPAYPWLWSGHDEQLHHFRRYTRSSLRQTLESAGLQVQRLTNFNAHLLPVIAGVRGMQRLLGRGGVAEEQMPKPTVNALLTKIFSAEAGIVTRFGYPAGVSLLAIASRA